MFSFFPHNAIQFRTITTGQDSANHNATRIIQFSLQLVFSGKLSLQDCHPKHAPPNKRSHGDFVSASCLKTADILANTPPSIVKKKKKKSTTLVSCIWFIELSCSCKNNQQHPLTDPGLTLLVILFSRTLYFA